MGLLWIPISIIVVCFIALFIMACQGKIGVNKMSPGCQPTVRYQNWRR